MKLKVGNFEMLILDGSSHWVEITNKRGGRLEFSLNDFSDVEYCLKRARTWIENEINKQADSLKRLPEKF